MAPIAILLARRLGAVDEPGKRRVHDRAIPRLGGLAIYGGFMIALALLPDKPATALGFVLAGSVAFLVGLLDDLLDLKPGVKLAGQVLAASILPFCGVSIRFLTNPWGGTIALGWLGLPATVIWVVAMMNMLNLIDGLDGLAAGVSAIAASSLLFLPQCIDRPFVAALCLLTIGCAVGFLPFNFHPARTFMGDGGAHFLGFVLGFITVAGALKGRAALTLSVPVFALAVPFFDTASAIVRRWRNRQPLYMADRGHLHHRLLFLGFNQRQTVLLLYLWSAIFGIGSNFLARLARDTGAVILTALLAGAVYALWQMKSGRFSSWQDRM